MPREEDRFQVARPAYPQDDPQEMAQRSQEDWVDYPDMVYRAEEAEEEAFAQAAYAPAPIPAPGSRRRKLNGG